MILKTFKYLGFFLLTAFYAACIGDDFVDDFIEPTIKITNPLDTLGLGDSYQFNARLLNNVGQEEQVSKIWSSSHVAIVSINEQGIATAIQSGSATIQVNAVYNGNSYTDELELAVGQETITNQHERTGTLQSTSSYELEGDFSLTLEDDVLKLNLASNYQASTALPGLYVYLSNNPASVNTAFEIGEVMVFSGAHYYELPDEVELNEYQYVLYFCKPFNVKVGDGKFDN